MTKAPPKHQETLALILARAGSKGLPGKNELVIAGRPMLAWTADHARAAGLTHIALTTDGDRLAAMGQSLNLEVIHRPADLASDTATVDAAARHAVEVLEAQRGKPFQSIVLLYANVPVRPTGLINRALTTLHETGCDSVQSVCPVGKNHPWWMKTIDGEGRIQPYVDNTAYRRQDLPPVYMLDGGLIALKREALFITDPGEPHAFLGSDRRSVITQPGEVIDIDTAADLAVAEATLMAQRHASPRVA
ncbi:cytidylyltransferase domain-containing protein [Mucisphaera sp.]|uniref:acylneuraminate cytidylyltransferase family protein n=1 Tax=Mucisphaera sp. TaxID=2913024 RepID=UPI003D0F2568